MITVDIKRRVKMALKLKKIRKKVRFTEGKKEVESYILKVIKGLSESDNEILDGIVAELGEWTTVREVAKYFDVHTNTIYNLINEDVIIVRRVNGRAIRIYTKSLVCMLED